MTALIDAVFEHGVFRPLQPLAIEDRLRVRLSYERSDSVPAASPVSPHAVPQLLPSVYEGDELPEDEDRDWITPPQVIGTASVRIVDGGPWIPTPLDGE